MSRNFISEQELIDRLLLDDTSAFEELHRRYCLPLYEYCSDKLNSPADAKRIVRDIFIDLWEGRHSLPVNFSLSLHLYTEVRKAVVAVVNEKLETAEEAHTIEKHIIPGFTVMRLKKAMQPVEMAENGSYHAGEHMAASTETSSWWSRYGQLNLRQLRHAFSSIANFW